jgi:hypothetical protein
VRGGGRHRLHPDLLRPPHPPQDRPHPRPLDQVYHVISLLDSRRVAWNSAEKLIVERYTAARSLFPA